MKRKISVLLAFLILISIKLCVFGAELLWLDNYGLKGREMPFRPYDKSISEQNPPDFSWQYINGAVYAEIAEHQ